MPATWADVARARQATPPESNIEELLRELAQERDLDAAIQLELLELDARVKNGDVRPCEAFAEALGKIADTVEAWMLAPDVAEETRRSMWKEGALRQGFLTCSWTYLVGADDRNAYSGDIMVSSAPPKGGWDAVAPAWLAVHEDGDVGSGYVPPHPGDADRAGRRAHFLANAILSDSWGTAGSLPAIVLEESSPTDQAVNAIGLEFGGQLRNGNIAPGGIAGWVKAKLCTEGRCAAGTITSALVDKLRYGLITGEAGRALKEVHTHHDPTASPPNSRTEYTRKETLTVTARVRLAPGASSAVFGRVVDGNWKVTSLLERTGHPDERREGHGPVMVMSGDFVVDGPGAGSYRMSISGNASPAAVNPDPESYLFDAGGDDRSLCADESLSGSDRRKTSHERVRKVGDPRDLGELLRGATEFHDVTDSESRDLSWKWKFTFRPAPVPEHVEVCARRYLSEEALAAGNAFTQQVMQQLMPAITDMGMSGRGADAQAIVIAFGQDSVGSGDVYVALTEHASRIANGCEELDQLWIHGDDEGELQYKDALERHKGNIAAFAALREQLADTLASAGDSAADKIRSENRVAAGNIDELCAKLRREGLEAFMS